MLRLARRNDLPEVLSVTREVIAAMWADGIDQWDEVYPGEAVFAADIDARAAVRVYERVGIVTFRKGDFFCFEKALV